MIFFILGISNINKLNIDNVIFEGFDDAMYLL